MNNPVKGRPAERDIHLSTQEQLKLKNIGLSGYKSYSCESGANVDLKDINLIIGANGAGKSNFISFLEMVSYMSTNGFDQFVGRNGFAKSLLYYGGGSDAKICGTFRFSNDQSEDRYRFVIEQMASGGLFISSEEIEYNNGKHETPYRKEFTGARHESALLTVAERDKSVKTVLSFLQSFHVFHFNDSSMNSAMRSPCYIGDSHYLRSNAGNLAAFLYAMRQNPAKQPYYARILQTIRTVIPRFDDFVLRPIQYAGTDDRISLDWKEKGSEEIFGPHQLSDGTIRFIALATLLLQPEDMLPKIIIIDEPELGLHPYTIHQLAFCIRQASKFSQIVISTQSADLLNEFSADDVIVAEYDDVLRSSKLRRLSEDELKEWLADYSLGELWSKNILGGTS